MLEGCQLLVVEDDFDGAAVIEWMLKSQHARSTVVETGEAALKQLAIDPSRFKVMLIDLALPQMDGFELLSRVLAQGAGVPTVAMTAFHTPELREKALQAGFDAYVPKPVDKTTLMTVLSRLLS